MQSIVTLSVEKWFCHLLKNTTVIVEPMYNDLFGQPKNVQSDDACLNM